MKATPILRPFDAAERRRLFIVLGCAAALVCVALVYSTTLRAPFVWDDHSLLERESASFRTSPLAAIFTQPFWPDTSASDGHVPYYRPLTLLSYRFDLALGGEADQFHFSNLALHIVATALAAFCAARIGASGRAAVVAALLWALAPRLTESVAWISGRTDVLAATFGLGAFALSPATKLDGPPARFGPFRLVLSGALLLGALFAKESGIAFAAAIVVASLGGERSRASKIASGFSVAIPLAVYGALRWVALRHHGSTRSFELSPQVRGLTFLEAVGRYAEMTLDALRPKTSIGLIGEPDLARVAVGAVVLVALVTGAIVYRRRFRPGVVVALALAAVALAPVLHLLHLNLSGAVTADRLLYIPLVGLALSGAVAAQDLPRRFVVTAGVVAGASGLAFAGATKARLDDYANEARFWLAAAEHAHVHNASPRNGLAGVVVNTDDIAMACELYEASRRVLAESGRGSPATSRRTRENLAACWAREGRYRDALALTEELATEFPNSGRIKLALGYARLHLLDFDGAGRAWKEAEARDAGLHRTVQLELADLANSRTEARQFAEPPSTSEQAWHYADFLGHVGRLPEAARAFSQIAGDEASTPARRLDATRFLVRYGHIGAAHEALERWKALGGDEFERRDLRSVLRARTSDQANVTALRPRIERLTQKEAR